MNLSNLVILDTETTGIECSTGNIIEIGLVYYNVPTRTVLHQVSTLIEAESNPAFEVNQISLESLKACDKRNTVASYDFILALLTNCDAIVAHNAQFDREWIEDFDIQNIANVSRQKPWICSKSDFEWPERIQGNLTLINIAANLGVPVVSAHRALTDCQLLADSFSKLNDLEERLAESVEPKQTYKAYVGYENRQLAKDAGFGWDGASKSWLKKMSVNQFEKLKAKCDFNILCMD